MLIWEGGGGLTTHCAYSLPNINWLVFFFFKGTYFVSLKYGLSLQILLGEIHAAVI